MSDFDVVIALTPNAGGPREARIHATSAEHREEVLEGIAAAIEQGTALVIDATSRDRRMIVNAAHIVYAE